MIIYEDYDLPLPQLRSSQSKEGLGFIRSNFEYAPRQRATYRGKTKSGFGLVLKHHELLIFEQFWAAINYGADQFTASFLVHGNDNINKTLRFTTAYSLKPIGALYFEVNLEVEILNIGTLKVEASPIVPYNTLYPSDTLIPLS